MTALKIPRLPTYAKLHQWILGNTFPCVVFGSFGSFWFAFGITLIPSTGSYGAFSPNPNNPALGLETAGFNSGWGTFHKSIRTISHANVLRSILPGLHGGPVPGLRHLRPANQLGSVPDPVHARAHLRLSCWCLLAPRSRQRCRSCRSYYCRRCLCVRRVHVGLVHLCRHLACCRRLPSQPPR